MNALHRFGMIVACCVVVAWMTLDAAQAQQLELKAKYQYDLHRPIIDEANLRLHGDAIRWDDDGARVTLTAGKKETVNPGVVTRFKIRGDFEITGAYDIIAVDWPTEGFGAGPSLYAAVDPNAGDAVSLTRRTLPTGKKVFFAKLAKRSTKEKDRVKTIPSTSATARIRFKRVGTNVQFWVADGKDADFIKMFEGEFDAGEIRWLQFGGNAGDSLPGMDLRLLDLTVHAEELPGLFFHPKMLLPAGPDGQLPPAESRGWLVAGLLVGGTFLFLVLLTAGAGLLLLRRGGGPPASASRD